MAASSARILGKASQSVGDGASGTWFRKIRARNSTPRLTLLPVSVTVTKGRLILIIMRTFFTSARVIVMLLGATFAGSFSAAAVAIPPGGLAVTASGNNLNLSFATASGYFYTAQMSPDMLQWTNCQPGVPGDGTVKTVTITNAISSDRGYYRFVAQQPASLTLPQGMAFSILGYDCGGIREQASAGFDLNTGLPTGVVALSTTCSGSGRGGVSTTHRGSAVVVWDLGGNVISATSGATVNPTTTTDGLGDVIYNSGTAAFLVVPVPIAPAGVTAVQTNDQFQVSWTPRVANPLAVTLSFLTATPVNSPAPILTNTVTGPDTSSVLFPLQPQTTYQITVASKTIGGTSPASAPFTITSAPATIPPSAPASVSASWSNLDPTGATDTIIASWQAPNPGNSPIDEYLVTITGSDGAGTFTQAVSGTTLTAYFNVDFVPNWSMTVQAHNAAGWGAVSAAYNLGGL